MSLPVALLFWTNLDPESPGSGKDVDGDATGLTGGVGGGEAFVDGVADLS